MDEREFRELGHDLVDRLADYLESVEEHSLYPRATPAEIEALFDEPLPWDGSPADKVLAELEAKLLPNCTHVNHPGYFGLITPSPSPVGILGDFITSTLNQNVGAYSIAPAGVAMERRTIRWLTDLAGYGEGAGGNLTSGGMMANFTGLKLARDWASGDRAQSDGLKHSWAVYASEERHVSVDKAVDAVGVGRKQLRALPTDQRFALRIDALEEAIAQDKRAGIRPMCIVGMAGTTNTGAIDDLSTLRGIADRERMWLHVDAAYGGGMLLSRKWPGLPGLERADSITIDPHKWFFAPLDVGAILVKDENRLERSFGLEPPYLKDNRDTTGERYQYYARGFEQSKRLRSLKVWMSLKRYGGKTIGTWVDRNVEQAKHLYEIVSRSQQFRAATEPRMSAICIRYEPSRALEENALGRLHKEVATRIEDRGRFWLSTTFLKGKWWFRICPVNIRTRLEHMDALFAELQQTCADVLASTPEPGSR
ncbi:MAG TPA: pyridoxal-dependent decarboxylase [Vicinamibacteria bacterium]|nr:pyridoxal-dependent decarboxylase [Vicinamibacteria bacterium]